jgi:hypothetical protein
MFDEETSEVIAFLALSYPGNSPATSKRCAYIWTGISRSFRRVQEFTASSTEINQNQTNLHSELKNVKFNGKYQSSLGFIKDIAGKPICGAEGAI